MENLLVGRFGRGFMMVWMWIRIQMGKWICGGGCPDEDDVGSTGAIGADRWFFRGRRHRMGLGAGVHRAGLMMEKVVRPGAGTVRPRLATKRRWRQGCLTKSKNPRVMRRSLLVGLLLGGSMRARRLCLVPEILRVRRRGREDRLAADRIYRSRWGDGNHRRRRRRQDRERGQGVLLQPSCGLSVRPRARMSGTPGLRRVLRFRPHHIPPPQPPPHSSTPPTTPHPSLKTSASRNNAMKPGAKR